MLTSEHSLVLLIDMQEKLTAATPSETAVINTTYLLKACQLLQIPVIATEQNPKGLGKTVLPIASALPALTPVLPKTSFSAWDTDDIASTLTQHNRTQIVLLGIETHICVFQTAVALKKAGYDVFIVADACASRFKTDKQTALSALRDIGCPVYTTEMILFSWLKDAKHPSFKGVQALIKNRTN